MPGKIQDLRKLYPEFDEYGYTDKDVLEWVGAELNRDPLELAEYYGLRDPDQGDFSRGLSAGVDSLQGLAYGAVGLAGDAIGSDTIRDFGVDGYRRNMDAVALNARETDAYEGINSFGDAVDFAQYYSGYAIPQAVTALASGGIGGLVGKQVVKKGVQSKIKDGLEDEAQDLVAKATRRGSTAGITTQAFGTSLGATYGQAVEQAMENGESIDDIDLGKVAGYGSLAGGVEAAADIATLGLAKLGPASNLMDFARKTRKRAAVTGGSAGAAIEGVTEGVQTGLEDLGAGSTMEDARFFDPTSMLAGAIGGGQIGVAGGALRSPTPSGTELDTDAAVKAVTESSNAQTLSAEDSEVVNAYKVDQENAQREADANAEQERVARLDLQRAAAKEYSEDDYAKERSAKLELDATNPETEAGAAFKQRIDELGLVDDKKIQVALKDFVAEQKPSDQEIEQGHKAELDLRINANQQALAEQQAVEANQPEPKYTAETVVRSRKKAIEKAETLLGEDFANKPEFDAVASSINGDKFKVKTFEEALSGALNPQAVTEDANALTDEATQTQLVDEEVTTLAQLVQRFKDNPNPTNLSADQKEVFTFMREKLLNNEEEAIQDRKGSFFGTNVSENTKVNSRGAADKARKGLRGKIDTALGLPPGTTARILRESRIQNVEAATPADAPVAVLDKKELGKDGTTSNLASANQGANQGRSQAELNKINTEANENKNEQPRSVKLGKAERDRADREIERLNSEKGKELWQAGVSKGGVQFNKLAARDKMEWLNAVQEFRNGTIDEKVLNDDLREIENKYDQDNAGPTLDEANPDNTTSGSVEEVFEGDDIGKVMESFAEEELNNTKWENDYPELVQLLKDKNYPGFQANVIRIKAEIDAKDDAKLGITATPPKTANRAKFESIIKKLTGSSSNMRVRVFNTEADAYLAIDNGEVPKMDIDRLKKSGAYGWVSGDENGRPVAQFILNRISEGREMSAFMHEVGGHIGIDSVIDKVGRRDIRNQIEAWSESNDGSLENTVARAAVGRLANAQIKDKSYTDQEVTSELVAYFLEEATIAGVDPTATTTIGKFIKQLKELFVAALDKLGFDTSELTTQDLVDLAYGAAYLELMHSETKANTQNPMMSASYNATAKLGIDRDWVGDKLGGPNAVKVLDNTVEIGKRAATSLKFVHNIVRDARETMPAIGRWYDGMVKAEAVRNEIRQSFADVEKRARTLKAGRLAVVNKFLGESTFDQAWGYDPVDYHPELFANRKVEVNTVKSLQFKQLSDDEKTLVTDIFAHGEKMRQRKIAFAKKLGVAGKFFTDASLDGPYAPLKRFGEYVAELKSSRLRDAELAATADGATKRQKELYEKLKSDPKHYVISFFDTVGSANEFIDQNKKNYRFSGSSRRAPNVEKDRVSNPEVYEKVMAALAASTDSSMDANAKTAFRDMVKGMYFQSMDERSARTSGARRLNRAGYEQNMVRSFISHGHAEAGLISQLENGTEINTALAQAGKETRAADGGGTRDADNQRVFETISSHYQKVLQRNDTPIQDRLTTANSVYMLLTSIGYHVTNATQPMMVTVPRIAGDFGNYNRTWSSMFRGYKYSMAAAKLGLNMETSIDLEKVPQEYRALLKSLQDRQLIDQGMEEDGTFSRFNTGFESLNRASDVLGTITSKLYNVAKFVEAQNRISTAIAAFDMARANPTKLSTMKMTPEQYATAVVEDTQGNFSQLDAPLLIKSLPKVVVQYRKYQLLMAWHYSGAFKQAFKGETPEIKAAGRRVLGYSIAHASMGAGATGVPLLSTAFWLTTFLGDEDEPQDMERWIKDNVDDGALGTALSRGLFSTFGIDLSTKLNQSKIFHPLPYAELKAGEAGATDILMGFAGPAGTTGVNFFRAAEYYKQGDVLKGIEYSVPKGIRSVAETYRLATEGYSTKSGTIIVDPREIDAKSLLLNAMGLPATEINRIKWTRGQQYELEQYFSKESSKIRKNYIEATRKRDRQAQADLRIEFRELQKSKDRVRPFFNDAPGALKKQSISTLLRAPKARERRERKEQQKLLN